MQPWFEKLAPDFATTFRRFPLPILLALVGGILLVLGTNQIGIFGDAIWGTTALGLFTGAAFGVGGVLFAESRPQQGILGVLLTYIVPALIAASFRITDTTWYFPLLLPPVGILWTSVAAFTVIGKGAEREAQQGRFWWLNHQALATAAIAVAAFAIIAIGLLSIERALATLFSLDVGMLLYRYILPFTGTVLVPVYWLSTIPKLSDYSAVQPDHPDFTSRAIGFLGQFVLAPLLLVYGLILLAYTAQIVIARELPQGTLAWMVMGFVVTGAGTWLVLYPPFLRSRPLVRLFNRGWFWLTLIPLALFAYGLWVRIDAYGLTPERVLLIGGGLWAVLLAAIFLVRLGDIRLIPGLAGLIITLMAVGPWNIDNAPRHSQASRLASILDKVGMTSADATPNWTMETSREARDLVYYLTTNKGRTQMERVLAEHGIPVAAMAPYANETVFVAMKMTDAEIDLPTTSSYDALSRDTRTDLDVSATPFFVGPVSPHQGSQWVVSNLRLELKDGALWFSNDAPDYVTGQTINLDAWVAQQETGTFANPVIDFTHGGVSYRLVVNYGTLEDNDVEVPGGRYLSYAEGLLFRNATPPAPDAAAAATSPAATPTR